MHGEPSASWPKQVPFSRCWRKPRAGLRRSYSLPVTSFGRPGNSAHAPRLAYSRASRSVSGVRGITWIFVPWRVPAHQRFWPPINMFSPAVLMYMLLSRTINSGGGAEPRPLYTRYHILILNQCQRYGVGSYSLYLSRMKNPTWSGSSNVGSRCHSLYASGQ